MKSIMYFFIFAIVLITQCFLEGWVIQHIWNWYLGTNYGLISFHIGLGAALFGAVINSRTPVTQHLDEKQKIEYGLISIFNGYAIPLVLLSVAYLLR